MNQAAPATRAVPLRTELHYLGPHAGTAPIDVTLVLRRAHRVTPAVPAWPARPLLTRGDFARQCGADPADLERLRGFARGAGLTETGADAGRRVLHLRASPQALQKAFGVTLGAWARGSGGAPFVGLDQPPALPPEAMAVLGLDARPVARTQFRRPHATPAVTYTPPQLGALYKFPAGTDGSGQTVALIELGGGFRTADLTQYFRGLGLTRAPAVTAVGVAGGQNQPGGDADGEVMLDIEVVGALAPAAAILVYFAPNTDRGFYEAISQAAHDTARRPSVISISWGGSEDSWSTSSRAALNSALEDAAALGLSVTVACGDNGSGDGESDTQPHVDFPASSPYALACGGTRLTAVNGVISAEVVWNESSAGEGATGGGVSTAYSLPLWQQGVSVPANAAGAAGPWRARCGRKRGPHDRLPGPGRRAGAGDRRHERRRAAVGGAAGALQPEARTFSRGRACRAVPARAARVPRYHQRQQRGLPRRSRVGCMHRPRLPERGGAGRRTRGAEGQ